MAASAVAESKGIWINTRRAGIKSTRTLARVAGEGSGWDGEVASAAAKGVEERCACGGGLAGNTAVVGVGGTRDE